MRKCKICKTETNNKIYCSNECKFSDKSYNKKRGKAKNINPDNKLIKHKQTGKIFTDINNVSGILIKYCKQLGEEFSFDKFEIIDYEKKEVPTLNCKYCDWKTIDIENKSGAYQRHIFKKHKIKISDHINQYPDDLKYFKKIVKRKKEFLDKNNYIICRECGGKFKRLINSHMLTHGMTIQQYKQKYGIYHISSENTKKLARELYFNS